MIFSPHRLPTELNTRVVKKVWFSWEVDVKEVSVQLSQPRPLPRVRLGKVAPGSSPSPSLSPDPSRENGSGDCSRRIPRGFPGQYASEPREEHGRAVTVLLRFVVSGARARVGIRTEKGFVMDGSVHAVEASGVGGITCLTIKPTVLWGGAGGGDAARTSRYHGKGSEEFPSATRACAQFLLCVLVISGRSRPAVTIVYGQSEMLNIYLCPRTIVDGRRC